LPTVFLEESETLNRRALKLPTPKVTAPPDDDDDVSHITCPSSSSPPSRKKIKPREEGPIAQLSPKKIIIA